MNIGMTYFEAAAGQPGFNAFACVLEKAATSERPIGVLAGAPDPRDGWVLSAKAFLAAEGAGVAIHTRHDVTCLDVAEALSLAHPKIRILCGDCPEGDVPAMRAEAWLGGKLLYSEVLRDEGCICTEAAPGQLGSLFMVGPRAGSKGVAMGEHGLQTGLHAALVAQPAADGPGGWRWTDPGETGRCLTRPDGQGPWDVLMRSRENEGMWTLMRGMDDAARYASREEIDGSTAEAIAGHLAAGGPAEGGLYGSRRAEAPQEGWDVPF